MAKRTYREFKQNFFTPINKNKCLNKDKPFFRSGLESQLMVILDTNPNVIAWNSEGVIIPYFKKTENRWARYFVDFYVKMKIGDTIREFLIEVKPHNQTILKEYSSRAKRSTVAYAALEYAVNQCKWEAAKQYCIDRSKKGHKIDFLIITEKNIATINGK